MAKAGSAFESITLKGRNFACDSESEPEVDLTKYSNETAANTDGTFRIKKTRKVQSISGVEIAVNPALGDLSFINDLQAARRLGRQQKTRGGPGPFREFRRYHITTFSCEVQGKRRNNGTFH